MKKNTAHTLLACATLAGVLLATATAASLPFTKRTKIRPPASTVADAKPAGAPLADLDTASQAAFAAGLAEFVAVEVPEGGLGPIFNGASCVTCHAAGGVGGASDHKVTRFGRLVGGRFDALEALGGSLLQDHAITGVPREKIPPEATVVAQRITTPLFGAGLIEAIPDQALLDNERRTKPDGVKGRAARVTDPASNQTRIGRFGWKAQQATLVAFAGDAYLNEMGITNRLFPTENAPNGRAAAIAAFIKPGVLEDAVDPVTGKGDIDLAADFMRLLAPPPPLRATANSLAGSRLFEQAGCAACHLPTMFTAAHPVAALAHKPVPLYADLLLHDMGSLGDGIAQAAAGPREMRTAPLWGLRLRPAYLHDGRARTIDQAIRAHDGEGLVSRRRFEALRTIEQQQVLEFLRTL